MNAAISLDNLEAVSLLLSPFFGLAGVWLGARLNRRAALVAAREEREHASQQEVQRRKEEAAGRLDEAAQEAQDEMPNDLNASEAPEKLMPIQTQLLQALTRNAVLDDREIDRRFGALNMTLVMAMGARQWHRGEYTDPHINLFPVMVAMRELRQALTCYQRREAPPPAKYPTSKELIALVHKDGGNNFNAINNWLVENEVGY